MDTENQTTAADFEHSPSPSSKWRPLLTWPALVLIILMVVARNLPRFFEEESLPLLIIAGLGPVICAGLILIWWLSVSRATWRERLAGLAGILAVFFLTAILSDHTMHGPGFMFLSIPIGMAAFAIGAALLRRTLTFRRTGIALLLAAVGFSSAMLFRNSGMTGDFKLGLSWRWQESPEEQLLAEKLAAESAGAKRIALPDALTIEKAIADSKWPGFRGADRSGVFRGPSIAPDWDTNPPQLLWKTPLGPGWSSFSVAGNFLFTQEQLGPNERVVCFDANTGRELWTYDIKSRFEDPLGGPGPRATPTVGAGSVFALGAEGWLMRLAAGNGQVIWKQNIREIANRELPMWGFSSSPLVTDSVVIVHAGGTGDKGVLAFDIESGELSWSAPSGDHSYSSPQLATVAGVECMLMMSNRGLDLLDPEAGTPLLEYDWPVNGYRALQPAVVDGDTIIIPTDQTSGTRRIRISKNGDGKLAAEDLWTSRRLKPDFNDFVVFEGHAYGFDGSVFTSINLADGERNWKGGRYGKGQVLLLENSGLLLVAGEQGQLVLLKATPEAHTELASFQALEGKTWNHPVVVGDRLYVRNSQEAACYRLSLAGKNGPE